MIHVVAMKCLIGLPLLIHIELLRKSRSRSFKNRGVGVGSFKNRGVGVGVLKIEESEFLCTDSTALLISVFFFRIIICSSYIYY
jgi:hypothetical protein